MAKPESCQNLPALFGSSRSPELTTVLQENLTRHSEVKRLKERGTEALKSWTNRAFSPHSEYSLS